MPAKRKKGNAFKKRLKKWKKSGRRIFLRRKDLGRDIAITFSVVFICAAVILAKKSPPPEAVQQKTEEPASQPVEIVAAAPSRDDQIYEIQANMDASQWTSYQNQWYGFEIKYPSDWHKPVVQKADPGSKWEQKYLFRKKNIGDDDPYVGFDIVIYSEEKTGELTNTEEFQLKVKPENSEAGLCEEIPGHMLENENFSAEQIYIAPNDECYRPVLIYSLTGEEYFYNIIPAVRGGTGTEVDPKDIILDKLPDFFSVSTTLNLIEIKRPKPIVRKPKINAPAPVASTKRDSQGRRVCAKKSDSPGKSKQGKKKHMDMECCLDPDEYPNPHCYYPPDKYGKYL